MPDMLVHLLKLPPLEPVMAQIKEAGVVIRRAQTFEITPVREFIHEYWGDGWADEIIPGYCNKPCTVFIATRHGKVIGFGAFECTRRGFFGPTGVAESERGTGIGKALLLACLWGMREMGYVYGVIAGAGPVDFYARCVGATVIPDSVPGIYEDMLKKDEPDLTPTVT